MSTEAENHRLRQPQPERASRKIPPLRVGLLVVLMLLIAGTGMLWLRNLRLEQRLAEATARVQGLAELIEQADARTITRETFEAARDEIEGLRSETAMARAEIEGILSHTAARVDSLEASAGARERVISAAAEAVVFLQGSYGFVEHGSRRPLRFFSGRGGQALRLPDGQTLVTVADGGPVVQVFYTGTGFVVSEDGLILTNRHVALPWEFERNAQATLRHGFQPIMRRFIGYLPGNEQPCDLERVAVDEDTDLALLRCLSPRASLTALELTDSLPEAGDEVIVLGYPAGVNALLARSDTNFAEGLLSTGPVNFWDVARGLAAGGHIAPLATMGIVGQITPTSVVYDAETARGGSGGPVLQLDGKVVAVNSAILQDFGGSNLGVPAAEALRLIARATATASGKAR